MVELELPDLGQQGPGRSGVLVRQGHRGHVFVPPAPEASEPSNVLGAARSGRAFGLADYADRLIAESLQATANEREPEPVVLAGHSLGGTFAALFAALHPEHVRGLVLLGSPLHFGPDAGGLDRWFAAVPAGSLLAGMSDQVPGSVLGWRVVPGRLRELRLAALVG